MGTRAIENRVKKLKEIERQQAELEKQAQQIREEIKAYMRSKEESEIHVENFIVRNGCMSCLPCCCVPA